jgi:hypothetical protein
MQKETRNDIVSWASQSELSCRQQNSDAFSSMVLCGVLSAQMWFSGVLNIFHRCYFQLRFLTNKGTWGFSSEQPTCVGESTL